MDIQPAYLDLKSLSRYASISVAALRGYIGDGLPYFKLKGKILVKREEFDAWLEGFRCSRQADLNDLVTNIMDSLSGAESDT